MTDVWDTITQRVALQQGDEQVTYFGVTDTRGQHVPFGIKRVDRTMHTYVIGKSGMGKSTLLENMAVQDILRGEGMCFIDPHGGTADKLLSYVPEHRIKDVLYFAPFDLQYPVSFNVLENVEADKRHLAIAGLMSAFEKIWIDAWSARMAYILQNTLAALLEYEGATILGINRMYTDKMYRKNVVQSITDPTVRMFWVDEFTKYTDKYVQEATPAIQNKIGQFASNALIRNVIGQGRSSFDIRELMDKKKIFIVNLSKGRVGEGNANLLGSMLVTKIYLAAMSRADVRAVEHAQLPPFYLYVDEFQNFANKSFAEILSEARKYKLGLTIAHQYIEQMEEEVRAAVFGNVGTMISFRVGAYDAEVLEKEYAPVFTMDNIVNLGPRQVYLKLMIDSVSSPPFSASTLPPVPQMGADNTEAAIAYSRATYSQPREEVEQEIKEWSSTVFEDPEAEEKEQARQQRRAEREAQGDSPTGGVARPPRSSGSSGSFERRSSGQSRGERPQNRRASDARSGSGGARQESRFVGRNEGRSEQRNEQRPERHNANLAQGSTRSTPAERREAPAPQPSKAQEKTPDELRGILAKIAAKENNKENNKEQKEGTGNSTKKPATAQAPKNELHGVLAAFRKKSERFENKSAQRSRGAMAPQQGGRSQQQQQNPTRSNALGRSVERPPQENKQENKQGQRRDGWRENTHGNVQEHTSAAIPPKEQQSSKPPQGTQNLQKGNIEQKNTMTPEEMRAMLGE